MEPMLKYGISNIQEDLNNGKYIFNKLNKI